MHILQAGRGILHDELPQIIGVDTHGFQILINHSKKNRLMTPKSMHATASEVPQITAADYKVRVV